ncbi:MAG: hypothetical protein ACHQ51_15870, partial [Elusimicrobiota bacterium]
IPGLFFEAGRHDAGFFLYNPLFGALPLMVSGALFLQPEMRKVLINLARPGRGAKLRFREFPFRGVGEMN